MNILQISHLYVTSRLSYHSAARCYILSRQQTYPSTQPIWGTAYYASGSELVLSLMATAAGLLPPSGAEGIDREL
jgi:hypothetical protein